MSPIRYRKRLRAGPVTLNVSRSGVSTSLKAGPVTWNPTRGSVWANLPGNFYYQGSTRRRRRKQPQPAGPIPNITWAPTAIELVTTRHNKLWHQAPLPHRWHTCRTWTTGRTMEQHLVEYCACGAIRMDGLSPWFRRNSRRKQ